MIASATSEPFVLPIALWQEALERPDDVFYEEVGGPRLTYVEFHRGVLRWATVFHRLGIEADERVAILMPTGLDGYQLWLGLAWLRAVAVPLNTDFRGNTLAHALNCVAGRFAVIHSLYLDRVTEVRDSLAVVPRVLLAGGSDVSSNASVDILLADVRGPFIRPEELTLPQLHDLQAVIFTSGTTGPSKGVLVPWGHMEGQNSGVFPDEVSGEHRGGGYYSFYPGYHASGMGSLGIAVYLGMRVVIRSAFSASSFWDDVRAYGVTHTILIGAVASWLLTRPATPFDAANPLQKVGLYPLVPQYREFEARFGVQVSTGFGMTEAGMPFSTNDPVNHESVGRSREGYSVRIADANDYPLPAGTVGELLLRHERPWRMNVGYLGRPEESARAWRNGWFHTGDGFMFDDDGNYYFVDRLKDCLRRRGENISSMEVEADVITHPAVVECACIGVPADDAEEEVMILAVMAESSEQTPQSLLADLADRMPRFMVPRYVEFVDALPKSANGKVQKAHLRARGVTRSTWDRLADRYYVPSPSEVLDNAHGNEKS